MFARVADELSGLVEAHRLAVEHGGAEHVGMVTFDPRRNVDQLGEAHRVALGKTIGAETLDLAKATLGELRIISARGHALHELGAIDAHVAIVPEGGHGPAKTIGLLGRELSRFDGQPHGLFLEERYAQGLAEHIFQFVGGAMFRGGSGKAHRLTAFAPTQIRVHHVALDGTGTHDRHFDDQIVELAGLQPGQHGHLGAALDLEHAHGIGP